MLWCGAFAANLVAALGLSGSALISYLSKTPKFTAFGSGNFQIVYAFCMFVPLPILMGFAGSFFLKRINRPTIGFHILQSLLTTVIALVLSYLFLKEGSICILMASPLLFSTVILGSLFGRAIFINMNKTIQVSFAPVLIAWIVIDSLMPHYFHSQITDRVVIRAKPQKVWKYIGGYPAITTKPDYWLFKMGLPAPVQSTISSKTVGADRKCIFEGNVVFDEKITELEPNKKLTFDVTHQPKYPEINGHFVLDRGQFLLHDNGDGTTTLIGTSWYQLKVYPSLYFDLWAQDVIRNVHLRVMNHVKELAEAAPNHE